MMACELRERQQLLLLESCRGTGARRVSLHHPLGTLARCMTRPGLVDGEHDARWRGDLEGLWGGEERQSESVH
jgi:hypothetical protein